MVQKIFATALLLLLLVMISVCTYHLMSNIRDSAVESEAVTVEEAQEVDKDRALIYTLFNILYWRNTNGQK